VKRVYFIRAIGWAQGPVKIGCSFSPTSRRKGLQAWSPLPLEIVAELEGGLDIEARLHERFLEQHRGYEWFNWSPALQVVIDSVNEGTFDIATLPAPRTPAPTQRGKAGPFRQDSRPWAAEQPRGLSPCLTAHERASVAPDSRSPIPIEE